jgi:hypothetical protein
MRSQHDLLITRLFGCRDLVIGHQCCGDEPDQGTIMANRKKGRGLICGGPSTGTITKIRLWFSWAFFPKSPAELFGGTRFCAVLFWDKQFRGLSAPRNDGAIAVLLAVMFLVGMTLGGVLSEHQTEPAQIASIE